MLLLRNKSRRYWLPFRELSLQLRAKKRKKQNKNEAYLSRRHAITKLLKWRSQIRSDVAACFLQDRQSLENAGSFKGSKELVKLEECNSDIWQSFISMSPQSRSFLKLSYCVTT